MDIFIGWAISNIVVFCLYRVGNVFSKFIYNFIRILICLLFVLFYGLLFYAVLMIALNAPDFNSYIIGFAIILFFIMHFQPAVAVIYAIKYKNLGYFYSFYYIFLTTMLYYALILGDKIGFP